MKTNITYPEKTGMHTAIIIAVLFFMQASLTAGDNAEAKQDFTYNHNVGVTGTEFSNVVVNTYDFLCEEADEPELEIEDWMCNIQNGYDNSVVDEEEFELEDWMSNIHNIFWLELDDAKEPELAIENWMTNPDEWTDTGDELMLSSK